MGAGTTTGYCFGDDVSQLGEYAWYKDNSEKTTHPIGELKPNAGGIFDMHGNVWEWCQDWHGPYESLQVASDPTGPASGQNCVACGGTFYYHPKDVRTANRLSLQNTVELLNPDSLTQTGTKTGGWSIHRVSLL